MSSSPVVIRTGRAMDDDHGKVRRVGREFIVGGRDATRFESVDGGH
jgi:hypothetical protein